MNEELRPRTNKMVDCGCIWRKYTKTTNKPYLFIKIEMEDSLGVPQTLLFRAFKNDYKKSDKEPDLRIYLATDQDGNIAKANPRKPYVKKEIKVEIEEKKEESSQAEKENDDVL